MPYLFPWIFLILGSLVGGIGLFIWAYHSGQFSDQGRARYLPLRGTGVGSARTGQIRPVKKPYELFILLTSAIAIFLLTLVLVLLNGKGR
jgi:hypothetical protein